MISFWAKFVAICCICNYLSYSLVVCKPSKQILIREIIKPRLNYKAMNRMTKKGNILPSYMMNSQTRLQALINPTIAGGLLSGGLHAISGPDHLAALLPSSVGKSGLFGARLGAIWGMGHGASALLLGYSAFFLKGKLSGRFEVLKKLANVAESAVGVSLVAIGLIGIKESMESSNEVENKAEGVNSGKLGAKSGLAIFFNGVLHGFSWDGAPSIAPAVAMSSWRAATYFLTAYSIGTMLTMSLSAGVIGLLSSKLGELSEKPNLPKVLSLFSSVLAMIIGVYWIFQTWF